MQWEQRKGNNIVYTHGIKSPYPPEHHSKGTIDNEASWSMRCSQRADLCINEMCAAVHWADKGSHRGLGPGENKWSKWTKVIRGKKKKRHRNAARGEVRANRARLPLSSLGIIFLYANS